jgi:hypothetical protein
LEKGGVEAKSVDSCSTCSTFGGGTVLEGWCWN